MNRQIRRLGIGLVVLFVALFVKLNELQVVRANQLANAPGNTRKIIRDFGAPRGVIQSADGVVLARSIETNDEFERLRQYPEGALFAHITGFFSFTFGTDGVERNYNDKLAGRDLADDIEGFRDLLVDRRPTSDVTLTITKQLQQVATAALGSRKGAVVALDPTTGAVLAMASFPSYDPNPLSAHDQKAVQEAWRGLQADPARPMLPRAFRERYAPGSTFKVVTATAALDRAPELATKSYPVLRELDLPQTDSDLPNFGGGRCGGTLPQLFRVSCNTGFGQMGLDMGAEALSETAAAYGFGDRPPFDLTPVARSVFAEAGAFRNDKPALAKSAIGQENVSATPIEMALVAAAVANGGVIMKPHVVGEVVDSEGERDAVEPGQWRRVMPAETAAALRAMMVDVVRSGTGTRVALPGVQVAAKTGTAQTTGDNAHAWMVAFAPADAPRVAVAVIVESQPGLGDLTGGRHAAPVARAVIEAALSRR